MKGFGRAGLSALATSTLVIGACAAFVAPANADANFSFTRVGGNTRYDVSANVANQFGTADHVILASGEDGKFGDALAANYLAGVYKSPVLLTQLDTTPDAVKAAIQKTGATKITIVGGPLSVSDAQEQALKDAGYTVDRLQGTTRYDVDAAIINASTATGNTGIIATGEKFPDALAAGPLAFAKNIPVGLVQRDNAPSAVLDALKARGVNQVIVLGGDLSISQETRQAIENAGIKIIASLNGANRAAVATLLASYEVANYGFTNDRANVATGREFGTGADALSAGPLTGKENRPLLITAGDPKVGTAQAIGPDLINWLQVHANTLTGSDNQLFGGPLSISDDMKSAMEKAAQQTSNNQSFTVSPSGAQQATPSTNAKPEQGATTFTFSGVTGDHLAVALFPCNDVTTDSNGATSFTDTDATANQADDLGNTESGNATIEQINGAAPDSSTSDFTVSAVNGSVSVVVNSSDYDCVVPVLFNDANTNGALDLNSNNQPSESFAAAGPLRYIPAEAANGDYANGQIQYVDKTKGFFVVNGESYYFDSNDTPFYDDSYRITPDQFAQAISVGDSVDMYTGDYSRTAPNAFDLYSDVPGTPTNVTSAVGDFDTNSADTKLNDIKVSWTAPSPTNGLIDHYEVYSTDANGNNATFAANTDDATGTSVVIPDQAPGDYYYVVYAVSQTGDYSDASGVTKATVTAPAQPATHDGAPKSTAAVYQDGNVNGNVDNGDILRVTFDETMSAPALTASLQLTDTDGTVGTVTNGLNSTWKLSSDGNTYVITLTGAPVVNGSAGTTPGVQYPATVTAATGAQDTAASNTPAGAQDWDVAGSPDHTF